MRAPPQERVLRFDAFTLDLCRCALSRADVVVPLRPQAFDMLRYLAEHRGQLVSKEELVSAIWRKPAVSDDSLVKCIRDIREALADHDQRIIETVRSRGYLFAADVFCSPRWRERHRDTPPAGQRSASRAISRGQRLAARPFGRMARLCSRPLCSSWRQPSHGP